MIITPVDSKADLFIIENILPKTLVELINKESFWDYNWEEQPMQLDWKRRKLLPDPASPLSSVDQYYNEALSQIEYVTGIEFEHKHCWSSFWLDYEGFDCSIHEDGAERNYNPLMAMQIYLTESEDNLGTTFYHDIEGTDVRYVFPYKQNTGYLMLNHPGQFHGMLTKVPANHLRLSSYTYFGKFNHK
jgi:hypothetical protein